MADVFRRDGDADRADATPARSTAQRRVMTAIERGRPAALGGHVEPGDHGGHPRIGYHSCRDRHGPPGHSRARAARMHDREAAILDTPYCPVVFTVPDPGAAIAFHHKAVVYRLLVRTVAETLRTRAADPRHRGAAIGVFAVLPPGGQTLVHPPHLHGVIPGGGLSPDGTRGIACRSGFFLPVRVLSRLVRRLVLPALDAAFEAGELHVFASRDAVRDRPALLHHRAPARQAEWVVYAKPPSPAHRKSSTTSVGTRTASRSRIPASWT